MVQEPRLNYDCRYRTASQLPLPLGEERGEGAKHSERIKASFDFCGNGSVVPLTTVRGSVTTFGTFRVSARVQLRSIHPAGEQSQLFESTKRSIEMISINRYRVIGVAILCALIAFTAQTTFAQDSNQPARPAVQKDQETNLD